MSKCPNCGEDGPHFAPPSMGEAGFYICERNAMTAEKMTLAEALDVAILVLAAKDRSEHKHEAAAVLREFRERGLPFYEAAKRAEVAYAPMLDNPVASNQRAYGKACDERRATYRRLTTEGE